MIPPKVVAVKIGLMISRTTIQDTLYTAERAKSDALLLRQSCTTVMSELRRDTKRKYFRLINHLQKVELTMDLPISPVRAESKNSMSFSRIDFMKSKRKLRAMRSLKILKIADRIPTHIPETCEVNGS